MVVLTVLIFFTVVLAALALGGKAFLHVWEMQDRQAEDIRGAMSPDYDHLKKWRI